MRLRRYMAQAIDSRKNDENDNDLSLRWSGRVSLTRRILAVNIFALTMLAGGFFYLDSYRSRIVDSRVAQAEREARLIGEALAAASADRRPALAFELAQSTGTRAFACSTRVARRPGIRGRWACVISR